MPDVELTTRQAADKLRITPRAVRQRLASGRLGGHKAAGPRGPEWRVFADSIGAEPELEPETGKAAGRKDAATGKERAGTVSASALELRLARLEAKVQGQEDVIVEKDARIATLERAIDDRQQSVERLEILLQQVQRMLPAAQEDAELEPETGKEDAETGKEGPPESAEPQRSLLDWFLGRGAKHDEGS